MDYGQQKDRKISMTQDANRFVPPGLPKGQGQVTQNGFVTHKKVKKVGSAK